MKRFLFPLVMCLLLALGLAGCASMTMTSTMTPAQKADLVVTDIEASFDVAVAVYPGIIKAVPDKADEIRAKVEPAMSAAGHAVAALRHAVEVWLATGEGVDTQDWAAMRANAAAAVGELVVMVAEIRAHYGV